MIIDSHCHLDYEPLSLSLDAVVDRAKKEGVEYLLTISTKDNKYKNILNIINNFENVYGTYGIHPHETENNQVNKQRIIKEVMNFDKIIGIGETGLDFFYNHSNRDSQIISFKAHIEASIELKRPIIIHSRNAEKETFDILNSYKSSDLKILMHCFTGSLEFAQKLMTINAFFSASGIITFNNSNDLQNTFRSIPKERLLIETDSPFLAPIPMRGKKNEPSFIKYTINKLSKLKNMTDKEIIKITTNNFDSLFS